MVKTPSMQPSSPSKRDLNMIPYVMALQGGLTMAQICALTSASKQETSKPDQGLHGCETYRVGWRLCCVLVAGDLAISGLLLRNLNSAAIP